MTTGVSVEGELDAERGRVAAGAVATSVPEPGRAWPSWRESRVPGEHDRPRSGRGGLVTQPTARPATSSPGGWVFVGWALVGAVSGGPVHRWTWLPVPCHKA
jgi:hypothetical protein